jgi:hypothetical protein
MGPHEKVQLAVALTNSEAAARIAVAGTTAVCNELARLGALDAAAVKRIKDFVSLTAEQSGASQQLIRNVSGELDRQFGDLEERIGNGLYASKSVS